MSEQFFHLIGAPTARAGGMMTQSLANHLGEVLSAALIREVRALKTHEHNQPARGLDGQYVQLGSVIRAIEDLLR